MDIFFADIRGLTPALQTPAETGPRLPLSPPVRLAGSFDTESASQSQTIEFNEFFDHLSAREPFSDVSSQTLPDSAWREYLAQAPVRVTTDGEPALMRPGETAATLRVASMPVPPGQLPAVGENLPGNGKSLPGPAPVAPSAAIAVPNASGTAGAPLPPTAEAPRDAERTTIAAAAARTATPPADLQPAAQDSRSRAFTMPFTPPAQSADARPAAKFVTPDANQIAIRPEIAATDRPPIATPARAPRPTAAPGMSTATISIPTVTPSASMIPNGTAPGEALAPVATVAVPGSMQYRAAGFVSAAEPGAAAPSGSPATTDAAPANALRPTSAAALPAAAVVPEPPSADGLPARVSEAPAQVTANLAAPGTAAPGAAAPGTNPALLPPHLESLALPRQADASDWGKGLGERVGWMIDQRHNSATIRLDPPTLGKLEVQVRIADDATTITIQAQHAPTRELIEASAARMRDFLQESGFQNVNVDVSQRQDQQQARAQVTTDAHGNGDEASSEPDHPDSSLAGRQPVDDGASLVDLFA